MNVANFNFDPSQVAATFEVFPKDEYEFLVTSAKSFFKAADGIKKTTDQYGVRFGLKITQSRDGKFNDKKTIYTVYLASDGGQAFAKQFMMACLGYGKTKAEEERFDRETIGADWGLDWDTGGVGEAWKKLVDQRVIGALDTQPNQNNADEMMQQFKSWRSLTSGAINSK